MVPLKMLIQKEAGIVIGQKLKISIEII